MKQNLTGELTIMDSMGIKPNYAALGRKYGMDWRTVKKYHEGYQGKPQTREKGSKLDAYLNEIKDKLSINRLSVRGVYEFMVRKYGLGRIGSYTNFNTYVKKHGLKPKKDTAGHPRYETSAGEQGQIDWKEDIKLCSRCGDIFVINVFHHTLKFSRFSYLELSVQRRTDDVIRCLVNSFMAFGGIPEKLLFDNMSTIVITGGGKKRATEAAKKLAKEFNFQIRLCRKRSPETKGTVEAKNKVVDWIRAYEGEFETLEELARIIDGINAQMNITVNQETQMSPTALFYKEKEYLQPLPPQPVIDSFLCPNKYRVSNEGLIRYEGRKYSVDPRLIGEDVTADVLEDKLYIYYNGKLVTYHALNGNPVNYKPEHYSALMKGKVPDADLEATVNENLKQMDRLLESRHVEVSAIEATRSAEALIAYLNGSEYGRWIINCYAHLSTSEKLDFIKGVNSVLPYVKDKDTFISHIKYSLKQNMCRTLDFDCWVNDFMAFYEADQILTDEGFEIIKKKYDKEIDGLIEDMARQHKEEMAGEEMHRSSYVPYDPCYIDPESGEELPFGPKEGKG